MSGALRALLRRRDGRTVLVGYLPAAFPDRPGFLAAAADAVAAGVAALEVGVGADEAGIDGPVIAAAQHVVADQGVDPGEAVRLAGDAGRQAAGSGGPGAPAGVPVLVMTYAPTLAAVGPARFLAACAHAGVDAVLVPDLPVEQQLALLARAAEAGVDLVVFIASEEDLARVAASSPGPDLVYLQSSRGPTGGALDLERAGRRLADVRRVLGSRDVGVLVGFGVRSRDDVEALSALGADGVVVGSALVEAVAGGPEHLAAAVRALAGERADA